MRRRRVWGSASVAGLGLTGVGVLVVVGALVLAWVTVGTPEPRGDAARVTHATAPVATQLRSVALARVAAGRAVVPRRRTEEFSMLGVTWSNAKASVDGTIQVRTRAEGTGAWSTWRTLEVDAGSGDKGRDVRGGTEPVWVGRSDGVEVRARSAHGSTRQLPNGLRLDMIDPGTTSAAKKLRPAAFELDVTASPSPTPTDTPSATPDPTTPPPSPSNEPTVTASPSPTQTPSPTSSPTRTPTPTASPTPTTTIPPAPPSTMPRPPITSRAGWSADETLSTEPPIYLPDGIKAVAVHHTAGTNSYTCSQSAAIIRAIYAYDVNGRDYRDIGYNFLIDKCGTIFEGRKGGVDRPVYGAHARGWNSQTTGIAVLGNFNDTTPTTATLNSIARLAAWKLGQYGADPAGTTTMTAGDTNLHSYYSRYFTNGSSYSFPRIVGHRDVNNTECPGTNLYAKLSTIRALAAGPVQGLKLTSISGAGKSGSTYYTKATITPHWSATTPTSLIKRYDVLVDNAVKATAAGTATSASATITAGSHQLQIRAVHRSGRTTATPRVAVVAETTPPTFTTKPTVSLRTGTVNTSAVPVKLAWKAADNTVLKSVQLTAPSAVTFAPSTTSSNRTARSATSTTWTMKAADYAGNTTTASVSRTPVILQQTAAVKTGTWRTKSSSNYLGGTSYTSSTKNSSLTWTFTGRSAAWIVSRATGSGKAYVYVDGVKTSTVDLYSKTTTYRNAIWTKTWTTNTKHTIKIVVAGTSGRPAITTDGLAYLK